MLAHRRSTRSSESIKIRITSSSCRVRSNFYLYAMQDLSGMVFFGYRGTRIFVIMPDTPTDNVCPRSPNVDYRLGETRTGRFEKCLLLDRW